MTTEIRIEPVTDKRDLGEFIALPSRLYRGQPGFVAPLALERQDALSAKKNPYFHHAEAQFFLARRHGETIGRISAQIDRLYLERHRDATGQFGFLEAPDDPAVFAALFKAAAD